MGHSMSLCQTVKAFNKALRSGQICKCSCEDVHACLAGEHTVRIDVRNGQYIMVQERPLLGCGAHRSAMLQTLASFSGDASTGPLACTADDVALWESSSPQRPPADMASCVRLLRLADLLQDSIAVDGAIQGMALLCHCAVSSVGGSQHVHVEQLLSLTAHHTAAVCERLVARASLGQCLMQWPATLHRQFVQAFMAVKHGSAGQCSELDMEPAALDFHGSGKHAGDTLSERAACALSAVLPALTGLSALSIAGQQMGCSSASALCHALCAHGSCLQRLNLVSAFDCAHDCTEALCNGLARLSCLTELSISGDMFFVAANSTRIMGSIRVGLAKLVLQQFTLSDAIRRCVLGMSGLQELQLVECSRLFHLVPACAALPLRAFSCRATQELLQSRYDRLTNAPTQLLDLDQLQAFAQQLRAPGELLRLQLQDVSEYAGCFSLAGLTQLTHLDITGMFRTHASGHGDGAAHLSALCKLRCLHCGTRSARSNAMTLDAPLSAAVVSAVPHLTQLTELCVLGSLAAPYSCALLRAIAPLPLQSLSVHVPPHEVLLCASVDVQWRSSLHTLRLELSNNDQQIEGDAFAPWFDPSAYLWLPPQLRQLPALQALEVDSFLLHEAHGISDIDANSDEEAGEIHDVEDCNVYADVAEILHGEHSMLSASSIRLTGVSLDVVPLDAVQARELHITDSHLWMLRWPQTHVGIERLSLANCDVSGDNLLNYANNLRHRGLHAMHHMPQLVWVDLSCMLQVSEQLVRALLHAASCGALCWLCMPAVASMAAEVEAFNEKHRGSKHFVMA